MARLRIRDQRGVVLPTRLMAVGISAVAIAGLAFVATQSSDDSDGSDTVTPAATQPTATAQAPGRTRTPPTAVPDAPDVVVTPSATTAPKPAVKRRAVSVVVFNNSNITGLAGRTATQAQRHGWNVIGSDNWYGTVDTSTVYYGPELKAAAPLLAKDLGITSVKPAIDPMRADRLTVILTADYPH